MISKKEQQIFNEVIDSSYVKYLKLEFFLMGLGTGMIIVILTMVLFGVGSK